MTLTERERKTLRYTIEEDIEEIETLMEKCSDEDREELKDYKQTLESILVKLND